MASDRNAPFGYGRVGLLAALINGVSLLVIAGLIFYESYDRLLSPPEINIPLMLGIATIGFGGNSIMAFILGRSHEDLNIKAVWLHVMGDTLSSVGVIISGIAIYFTGWIYLDPIISIAIGGVIVWGGIRLIRDTFAIFLGLTPKGFDIKALTTEITAIPEVIGIHDVHLWSFARDCVAFSAHIYGERSDLARD
jgi:cobalt-zinc-cadmium efflux system protein